MKSTGGNISPKGLMFGVFCFIQATVLRSGYIIAVTRQDSWAMAMTGFLFAIPIVAIYAALLRKFPGKNLVEISDNIFGTIIGKIVSAFYLFFFLSLAALNAHDLGSFVVRYLMPETPIAVVLLISLIGCAYALRKGIENLMYLSICLSIIVAGAVAINSILVLNDMNPGFLKPFFQMDPMTYIQGTVTIGAVPMGEIIAFTMITPMLEKEKKVLKPLLFGLLLSAFSMAFAMLRDILTLGPLVSIVSLPSFESIRYVTLADTLTRMESIYAVVLILLFLFKVCILLYAFILGLGHILGRKNQPQPNQEHTNPSFNADQPSSPRSFPPLTLISTALVFFYSLIVFESAMENIDWGASTAPFFSLTYELLLPAVSLLVASLRKLGRAREVRE
ncbi:hypothetical protein J41TS12_11740 [Paenibacillus antibioticophila]|uniref:Uncharacterized protein n=1 Tax=Paenibacillus antibioticophila TaxID=1274374 RepID=A0A920CG05_9BACL|nr:endospore germination permease [Paenibacillus antibioticophila]GIO36313.1 hypothetical protein J41TS12_11740 [Paenibacillus antibioticophila]